MKDDKFIGAKAGKMMECGPSAVSVEVLGKPSGLDVKGTLPGVNIGYKAGYFSTVSRCVLVGAYAHSDFDDCIVIGDARPTGPRQLIIGNSEVSVSRQLSDDEFNELRGIFFEILNLKSGVRHENN